MMEVSLEMIGFFIALMGVLAAVVIGFVKIQIKVTNIEAFAKINDLRHANPEKAGIGTKGLSYLTQHVIELIDDTKATNAIVVADLKRVIEKNNDNMRESSVAIEHLSMAIGRLDVAK